MAKSIKFNLIIDNKPIRDIEGLRENFNINDIIEVYRNGLLQRWLEVRGYDEQLEKINAIESEDNLEIVKSFISIFDVETDENKVKEAVYSLEFEQEKAAKLEDFKKKDYITREIISDYHEKYERLLNKIAEKNNDMPSIKACVKEIHEEYLELFQLDSEHFYNRIMNEAPLAIFAVLMNKNLRNIFLNDVTFMEFLDKVEIQLILDEYKKYKKLEDIKIKAGAVSKVKKFEIITSKQVLILDVESVGEFWVRDELKSDFINKISIGKVFKELCIYSDSPDSYVKYILFDNLKLTKLLKKLGTNLKTFSGKTEGYWKDIEPKGKEFMIISMEEGNFIRNQGKPGEELSAKEINGMFVILDGIDYKSNNEKHFLRYMEV